MNEEINKIQKTYYYDTGVTFQGFLRFWQRYTMNEEDRKYGNCYNKKDDALDVYKEELAKNNGDVIKTLTVFSKDARLPFGFMQYFVDYKECIDYLGITENQFNNAKCIKWHGEVIERHTR